MSVTGFDPSSGAHLLVDGQPYTIQNGDQPWSISQTGDTLRFELRAGDQWDGDSASRERTEICGDTIYAQVPRQKVKVDRLMLHARHLAFKHPLSGERLHFEAPLPEAFRRFV